MLQCCVIARPPSEGLPVGEVSWNCMAGCWQTVERPLSLSLSPFGIMNSFICFPSPLTHQHGEQAHSVRLVRVPAEEMGSGAAEVLRVMRKLYGAGTDYPSGSYLCFKTWNVVSELIRENFYLPPAPARPKRRCLSC